MRTPYSCGFKGRVLALRRSGEGSPGPTLNGIEFLEVEEGQTRLDVHFVHPLDQVPAQALTERNVEIRGGVRVRDPEVIRVWPSGRVLTVEVAAPGDFSTYVLRLVDSSAGDAAPAGIDPALSEVEFSFKVDCPSHFDCSIEQRCSEPTPVDPPLDYLARDYASFRRLMLDRMSTLLPDWRERNPADVWVTVVERIAARADELSYYQDAVATEAYLDTARRRVSVRRHARLLDYAFHNGRSARVWVAFEVGAAADGQVLRGCDPGTGLGGTRLVTHAPGLAVDATLDEASVRSALGAGAEAFELLHDLTLYEAHSEMELFTWEDEECCLPKGATRAFLRDDPAKRLRLRNGDVLILEERKSPATGRAEDADRARRHVVRLVSVVPEAGELPGGQRRPPPLRLDSLSGVPFVEIAWHAEDALPFPLCLSKRIGGSLQDGMMGACANVALADHGRTVPEEAAGEPLDAVPDGHPYRPLLARTLLAPVSQQGRVRSRSPETLLPVDAKAPASVAFDVRMDDVRAAVALYDQDRERWTVRRDLLGSGPFAKELVVESEEDGRAYLRFGDGASARRPRAGDVFHARYRVGCGRSGNVGAETISHVAANFDGIRRVRNPMAARGGTDPHPLRQAKLYAPQAFRTQERAVTTEDYARIAERHPQVQRAVATRRWTGSWHTVFVTVDRFGGAPVDLEFERDLREFMDRFRLAGRDIEIDAPRFVSLDIAFDVCVTRGYFRADIERRLREEFSAAALPDGRQGFFHPDRFTFGDAVYLSALIARAMDLPGVAQVLPQRFQRLGRAPARELEDATIRMGRLEVARLDSDPNAPENGRIEFLIKGEA